MERGEFLMLAVKRAVQREKLYAESFIPVKHRRRERAMFVCKQGFLPLSNGELLEHGVL